MTEVIGHGAFVTPNDCKVNARDGFAIVILGPVPDLPQFRRLQGLFESLNDNNVLMSVAKSWRSTLRGHRRWRPPVRQDWSRAGLRLTGSAGGQPRIIPPKRKRPAEAGRSPQSLTR